MSPIKQLTLAVACVLSMSIAFAQNITVSGVVSATSGESIIGAGVLRQTLETLVDDLGLRDAVTFTGEVPNPEVLSAMAESMFFVMPSKPEGFGIVYLEAMSNRCITIGTQGEGIAELIESGKNGFLVPADDPKAVADAIDWCMMYPDEAEKIAQQGYLDTKELTWERNAEHYVQLFKELSDRN